MRFNYRVAMLTFFLLVIGVLIYGPYVWRADRGVSDCKPNPLITFPARSYEFIWASNSKRVEGLNICDKLQPPFKDFVRAPIVGEIYRSRDGKRTVVYYVLAALLSLVVGFLVGQTTKSERP